MTDRSESSARLADQEIEARLASLPRWKLAATGAITATWEFRDFVVAMQFVNQVAALAERAQHHPDIDIRWNKVTLSLSTHDAGGITAKDFDLARQIEAA